MAKLKATTFKELRELWENSNSRKLGNNTTFARSTIIYNNYEEYFVIRLHGHEIVRVYEDKVEFTLAGWNTVTTRERINQFIGINRVHQKNFEPYLNDMPIFSDEWYTVGVQHLEDAIVDGVQVKRLSLREVY